MITNITTAYLKAEKAFDQKKFGEAKKILINVIDHDKDFYSAYLLLYKLYDKENSQKKNSIYKELQRLNLDLNIDYKPLKLKAKKKIQNPKIATLSLVKLMILQGKMLQAKKSLKSIIKLSKNKKDIAGAKEILKGLKGE
jgi:hypothetical protein